jgi:hypothetical protein
MNMTKEQIFDGGYLYKLPLFLLSNENFRETFKDFLKTKYDNVAADIEVLAYNTSCTCKTKVQSEIFKDIDLLYNNIIEYTESLNTTIDYIIEQLLPTLPVVLTGKILKTTIENWEKFSQEIRDLTQDNIGNFSIVKEPDGSLLVFFI